MLRVTETMLKRDQIYLSATQKDTEAALSLMAGLERFEVPRSMTVAPGMEPMARRRRVMRHGQENPRLSELPPLVVEKLGESAVMVLVCSSSSSTSRWIRAEVEEFYRTHPRGPIIPVVLDGEPDPDHSRQAFEKPCFPENLKKADVERWVDGRATDWAETAPVAALATLLGVRVEQLIHHEALRSRRMKRQRSLACGAMLAALALASGWTLRWRLHETAKELTVYEERLASRVERWLEKVDRFGGRPVRASAPIAPPASRSAASAVEIAAPKPAPPSKPAAQPGFLEKLPKADPVAFQLAVSAWLDEAEKYLPDQLTQAERWIQKAREGLESGDGLDFGNELYRVHALSAVVAQRRQNPELSRKELLTAIEHWVAIPIQDLDKREEEGFNILATISPTEAWRDCSTRLVAWFGTLPGDEVKVSQRAGRLIDLVAAHPFLAPAVEKWLAAAAPQIQPAPADPVATAAKFAMLRADLLRSRKNSEAALAALDEGERALAGPTGPGSTLHRALAAQLRCRKAEYSGTAVAVGDWEKLLNQVQEGQSISGWESWFGADLRAGWVRLGDLHLRQNTYPQAIAAYNRGLEFTKNPEELAAILLKSGCAYRYHGDPAGAWDAFSLAIPILEESKDEPALLTALWGCVLAARELKRSKEGGELQQRATQLQAKLGASYRPPEFWREPIAPVESAPPAPGGSPAATSMAANPATKAPAPSPAPPAVTTPVSNTPATPVLKAEPVIAAAAAATPAAKAPDKAAKSGAVQTPKEVEERIATLQRQIAKLEADSKNRQTFRGLEELQNLYAELDSLLRRKLTGAPR